MVFRRYIGGRVPIVPSEPLLLLNSVASRIKRGRSITRCVPAGYKSLSACGHRSLYVTSGL